MGDHPESGDKTYEDGWRSRMQGWHPSVTEMLMGTDVPPRKAFIYEHATDAELDV